jgi:hypothetical protein
MCSSLLKACTAELLPLPAAIARQKRTQSSIALTTLPFYTLPGRNYLRASSLCRHFGLAGTVDVAVVLWDYRGLMDRRGENGTAGTWYLRQDGQNAGPLQRPAGSDYLYSWLDRDNNLAA